MIKKKSIVFLSTNKFKGGAAVACNNLVKKVENSSCFKKTSLLNLNLKNSYIDLVFFWSNIIFDRILRRLFFNRNPIFHSSGMIGKIKASKLEDGGYDIVHAHWVSNGLVSINQLYKLRNKLIITAHDSWFCCGFEHHPLNNKFSSTFFDNYLFNKKKKIIESSLGVIFPSKWQLDIYKQRLGMSFNGKVIPNIVNVNNVDNAILKKVNRPDRFVIGVCCQRAFENQAKGSNELIYILSNLNSSLSSVPVTLCIAGSKSRTFEFYSNRFDKIEIVELGEIKNTEIHKFYHSLDLFLNLSSVENLSTTLIESLAYSIPSIAFNVGGNHEIINNNITGYIVSDKDEMLQKIYLCSKNQLLMNKLSSNCRERYKSRFSPEKILELHLSFYSEVLEKRRSLT